MVKFFKSDSKIWWNKGNEVKPNFAEFNAINWTALNNFNVNYVNETTINVNVPVANEFDLLKIDENGEVTYWYLERINNKTETNRNCTFTLDLWCTYILGKRITLPYLQTNRTHLSRRWSWSANFFYNTKAEAIGTLTNNWDYRMLQGYGKDINTIIKANPFYQGTPFRPNPPDINWNYTNLIKYYVFKLKDRDNLINNKKHVIAIPQLFDETYTGNVQTWTPATIPLVNIYYTMSASTINPPQTITYFLLNEQKILEHLIDKKADYPVSGLGDFIGIFYGVNFWRIEHNTYFMTKWNNREWDFKNFVPLSFHQGNNATTFNIKGLLCLRISPEGNFIRRLNDAQNWPLIGQHTSKGLNILNDIDNGVSLYYGERLNFTNKFSITNNAKTIEITSEIPSYYDAYYDWLNQSKAQREAQLNVAKQQMITGIFKSITGIFTGGLGAAASAFSGNVGSAVNQAVNAQVGGVFGVANSVMQYQNTLRNVEATKSDMRTKINNELLGNDTQFLRSLLMINDLKKDGFNRLNLGRILDNNNKNWDNEVIFGLQTEDSSNFYNFAGWESNYTTTTQTIENTQNVYLKYHENFKNTAFQNIYLSPQIREGLITLLTNGVRIATRDEVNNNFA